MTDLREFIAGYIGKPVEWGRDDCSAWPARWLELSRGVTVPLPRYSTRQGAMALKERGLLELWSDALLTAGVPVRFADPQPGDVALIETRTMGLVGCIVLHGGIVSVRTEDGVTSLGPVRPRYIAGAWGF